MAAADVHARMTGRNQCQRDADVFLAAQQTARIMKLEGQTENRRYRTEGDVALLPCEPNAQDFPAFVHAIAHHSIVGYRAGVGTGVRAGKREARHFEALRQPWQVVVLLLFGTVMQKQFGGPERIRHHNRNARGGVACGKLLNHLRVRVCGKSQAAVLAWNDHAEEAPVLDELPDFRRQIVQLMGDLPVVADAAQLLHRTVQESLLVRGQARLRRPEQLVPVRFTAEQFAVPPNRSGIKRLLFRLRNLRQRLAEPVEQRIADQCLAQRRHR